MERTKISGYEDLEKLTGKELGTSDWLQITQEQINMFADATLDHQWIPVDTEKAKTASPFKSTIAHGYLTISLLPYLWDQIVEVTNLKMQVNYGIESFRFGQAVKVNSKVRLHAVVKYCKNLRGNVKTIITVKMEIEGERKPAYEGDVVFIYNFNS